MLKISENMLIAGILTLITPVINFMLIYILNLFIRILGNTEHALFLSTFVIDIIFYVIYIIFFSLILSITLVGGIIGILGGTAYVVLLSYYYSVFSFHVTMSGMQIFRRKY
uniref:Uncharacterized protein n=1 Tax=Metallosphaera hakonensis JCM 8857 = DSM 7519 TaxID=1293036 RepID=A0A2U9IQU0_9CREN